MSSEQVHADRNIDGIVHNVAEYIDIRQEHLIRLNPSHAAVVGEVVWTQLQNLRHVLQKQKSFGADRIRAADVLAGEDELKRKSLFSFSDQNSILWEIINKGDDKQSRVADLPIHDMLTFYRAVGPQMEHLVQLIQHWIYWDLPDAVEVLIFEEQIRRLHALYNLTISDEVRNRYKAALRKRESDPLTDSEIYMLEFKRLENALHRFILRRNEEEPFQHIIRREFDMEGHPVGDPYDYKKKQEIELRKRYEGQRRLLEERVQAPAVHPGAD